MSRWLIHRFSSVEFQFDLSPLRTVPMAAESTYMSGSVKSYPMSMSDRTALNKEEVVVKDDELTFDEQCHNFRVWCYNPKYREVCGRDGLAWAKIALYYFVYFMFLAGLFASFVAIFMAIVDKRIPTYRGTSNAIALDTSRPNPGKTTRERKCSFLFTNVDLRRSRISSSSRCGENPDQISFVSPGHVGTSVGLGSVQRATGSISGVLHRSGRSIPTGDRLYRCSDRHSPSAIPNG